MPLYLVETITTFKHQYIIDCKEASHAEDTVVCNEATELDQKYLGETIVTTREITTNEFYSMLPTSMNGHLKDKIIHQVQYQAERPDYSSNIEGLGI